jgi:hypothetical protein
MITLKLSARERDLVRLWIETMRERSGHWGDGAVTTPDEARVEYKLTQVSPVFTRWQLEEIRDWAASNHGNVAFTIDEILLLKKIEEALQVA